MKHQIIFEFKEINGDVKAAIDLILDLEKSQIQTKTSADISDTIKQFQVSNLTAKQYETYKFLREHDNVNGVHFSVMARAKNMSNEAASQAMRILMNKGYAKRVFSGGYRFIENSQNG